MMGDLEPASSDNASVIRVRRMYGRLFLGLAASYSAALFALLGGLGDAYGKFMLFEFSIPLIGILIFSATISAGLWSYCELWAMEATNTIDKPLPQSAFVNLLKYIYFLVVLFMASLPFIFLWFIGWDHMKEMQRFSTCVAYAEMKPEIKELAELKNIECTPQPKPKPKVRQHDE